MARATTVMKAPNTARELVGRYWSSGKLHLTHCLYDVNINRNDPQGPRLAASMRSRSINVRC